MDSELLARLSAALAPAYQVESEIGRGGMAIVYRGRDMRLKRGVAVKLLPPELAFRDDIRSRFLREAEMAARLSHPNIVSIYSVDERDGLVYFVMGLVEGGSLGDRIRNSGPLPVDEARRVLREVADALAYAHAHGVVHRDIKPDNVLLDTTTGRAMVTDFGIARAATEEEGSTRLTATGTAIGTPAYMSPEQCAGDRSIDGRSDLYSLGAVAYQMLTGEPPFAGNSTPAIMVKHVTEAPAPLRSRRADVPADLERIVMRLLEKNPAHRFADGAASP
ncbi:MAG: serine/threonine-protein kinase, partial [Gemmatimonadales bacterium]